MGLALALHRPLRPQGSVRPNPLARLLLLGLCLVVLLRLVLLLCWEVLQRLVDPLKEAWELVLQEGSLEVSILVDLDKLKAAPRSGLWLGSLTFLHSEQLLVCPLPKGLGECNSRSKHLLLLARSAVALRVPVVRLSRSGGDT